MWPTFASTEGFRNFMERTTNTEASPKTVTATLHEQRRGRAGARVGVSQDAARPRLDDPAASGVCYGLPGDYAAQSALRSSPRRVGWSPRGSHSTRRRLALLTFCPRLVRPRLYWLVPFCTWHIAAQYIRLICQHSAVEFEESEYSMTRTTIPTWLERTSGRERRLPPRAPLVPERALLSAAELHLLSMARAGFQSQRRGQALRYRLAR